LSSLGWSYRPRGSFNPDGAGEAGYLFRESEGAALSQPVRHEVLRPAGFVAEPESSVRPDLIGHEVILSAPDRTVDSFVSDPFGELR
jgi:hypothetical protein